MKYRLKLKAPNYIYWFMLLAYWSYLEIILMTDVFWDVIINLPLSVILLNDFFLLMFILSGFIKIKIRDETKEE